MGGPYSRHVLREFTPAVYELIDIYLFAVKFDCNLIRNAVFDKVQDLLYERTSEGKVHVLTFGHIKKIFENVPAPRKKDKAIFEPLRRLSAGIVAHHFRVGRLLKAFERVFAEVPASSKISSPSRTMLQFEVLRPWR